MFKAVMKLFRSLTTLLLGLTTAASVALAAPTGLGTGSASTGSPFAGGGQPKTVTVQLVSRQTAGIPRATNDIGILLKHEPGWHTYWQFSGDSGFAPSVEWKLPRRWTAEQIGWPTPQKHKLGPITNFVYSGEVLLPFNLDIPWGTPYGGTYTLRAKVDYLACKEVCIPGTAEVSMKLPVEVAAKPGPFAGKFEKTLKSIPEKVVSEHISAQIEDDRIRIDFAPLAGKIEKKVEFFPLTEGLVDFKELDRAVLSKDQVSLYLKASPEYLESLKTGNPLPFTGVIVADGGPDNEGWAIETTLDIKPGEVPLPWAPEEKPDSAQAEPATPTAQLPDAPPSMSTATALSFAFLGGLILNLMPCVFPVLSLKILQLVDGSRRKGALALHGFAFTGGVLLSMAALAGALMMLRSLGWAIGWGFQLQQPWVVATLILLFSALTLNLLGVFEFTAASHLADSRAVRKLPSTGPLGSFFTGVLAVVVASPCTAPFMGAALGYAVLQDSAVSMLIFLALGFGMALPWLILTLVPAWMKLLPRPGAWMLTFKRVMAIPMVAAALWLIWVLSRQVTLYGLLTVLFAMGSVTGLLWAVGREQYGRGRSQVLKGVCALVTVGCMVLLCLGNFDRRIDTEAVMASDQWQPWSEEAVNSAIARGQPVVVDFTAAWCVTCQFNKATALRTEAATTELTRLNYARFEADWTNRDSNITEMLNKFGRTGVPLYLLYKIDGTATVLPELLTESSFIAALKENVGEKPAKNEETKKDAP